MSKFTSGPWSVGATDPDTGEIEIVSEGRPYICLVLPGAVDDRTEANARLIAAVPELIALAERVARLNRDAGEIGAGMLAGLVDEARAAIAKAGGAA